MNCKCEQLKNGVQIFRIRTPNEHFVEIEDVGSDYSNYIESRKIWRCKHCGNLFAYLKIPYKDMEEIIVRAPKEEPNNWDWKKLADVADTCRWRGPQTDELYIL